MSIFGKIKNAIFGKDAQAAGQPQANALASTTPAPGERTPPAPEGAASQSANPAPASPAPSTPQPMPVPNATQAVDVAAIMDQAVKNSGQNLDWRHSIVDTMKALQLDSSLSERRELASELGYTGDTNDSATMNVWLQKALMKKLAENGGKVPAELTD